MVPNLIIGASLGRLFGILVNYVKARIGQRLIDPGAYALLGSAAFWSGTSRLLMTVTVISIETTLDLSHLLGIVITIVVATIVGNWFGESQYHMEIHDRKIPYLPGKLIYLFHSFYILRPEKD